MDNKNESSNSNSESEVEVINAGDCIGHWLEGDEACVQCEIEDSCKQMTLDIEGGKNEGVKEKHE